jgi:hypothetical protein
VMLQNCLPYSREREEKGLTVPFQYIPPKGQEACY